MLPIIAQEKLESANFSVHKSSSSRSKQMVFIFLNLFDEVVVGR